MLLEDKIDRARFRAVRWIAGLFLLAGKGGWARALLGANVGFVCPVCQLIRAIRRKKPQLAAHFSRFCSECRSVPRRLRQFIIKCVFCFFKNENRLLSDVRLFNREVCLPQMVPIFLKNQNWRI